MLFSGVVLYSSSVRFNDALYVRRFVCSIFSCIWTEYGDLIHFIPMLLVHLSETIGKLDFFHVSSGNEKKTLVCNVFIIYDGDFFSSD